MDNVHITFPTLFKRFLSVVIDYTIVLVSILTLYYGVFNNVFSDKEEENIKLQTFIISQLYVKNENENYGLIESNNYIDYRDATLFYYCGLNKNYEKVESYFDSDFYNNHGGQRSVKSIEWYNENILGIDQSSPSSDYFTFETINGEYQYNKIGILKEELFVIENGKKVLNNESESIIYQYFVDQYLYCFQDLKLDAFYNDILLSQRHKSIIKNISSIGIPIIIYYFIIPIVLEHCPTIGKRIFKLGYVSNKGTKVKKIMLVFRLIPSIVLVFISTMSSSIYLLMIAGLFYFIASYLSMVFTSTKKSIPDVFSCCILIDLEASTIFDTEEEFIEANRQYYELFESINNNEMED